MSGFDNEVMYAIGERLEPSTAQAIAIMQNTVNDVSNINHVGDPEGVVSANPSSLSHDPVSGNIYRKATGTGNTGWLIDNSTDLHVAKWIVNPTVNSGGNQTTITAALAAASSGDTIFIMPGVYTENLTGKAGVNLAAFECDALTPNVTIVGTFTFTDAGTVSISGINLQTNSAALLAVTGSQASIVNLKDCNVNMTNSTGITFSSSNASAEINFYNCTGNLGTTGITYWNHSSAGNLSLFYSTLKNTGLSTTTSTMSNGFANFYYCNFAAPITSSGTSAFTSRGTRYTTGATNSTCLTVGGSSTHFSEFDKFISGTASAISVISGFTICHGLISSSNTNAIAGAGTLSLSECEFLDTGVGIVPTIVPRQTIVGSLRIAPFNAYALVAGGTSATGVLQQVASTGASGEVLTSNGAAALPTWQAASGGIVTLNGNSGSATGTTVTLATSSTSGTAKFVNTGSTSTVTFNDAGSNVIIGSDIGTPAGSGNTGLGRAVFTFGITGGACTAVGTSACQNNTTGDFNTGIGSTALGANSTGTQNTCVGANAGVQLAGSYNTMIGVNSGTALNGSEASNVYINHPGSTGESHVMRLGVQGSSNLQQNSCFIAGITGVTVTGSAVLCSTSGELGTIASSRKYKENIVDLKEESKKILDLIPVAFNYISDENKTKTFGLIAEDVEKTFPELVLYRDGVPDSVKYHELPALILNELIKMNARLEKLEQHIYA